MTILLLKIKVILGPLLRDTGFCHPSTFSHIFSKVTQLIEAIFNMKPPLITSTKASSSGLGLKTKMVTMPIYGKSLFKNLFLLNRKPNNLQTLYVGDSGPAKDLQMMIALILT